MLRNAHRIFLILMLALVMLSGSFVVSMANPNTDVSSAADVVSDSQINENAAETATEVSNKSTDETAINTAVETPGKAHVETIIDDSNGDGEEDVAGNNTEPESDEQVIEPASDEQNSDNLDSGNRTEILALNNAAETKNVFVSKTADALSNTADKVKTDNTDVQTNGTVAPYANDNAPQQNQNSDTSGTAPGSGQGTKNVASSGTNQSGADLTKIDEKTQNNNQSTLGEKEGALSEEGDSKDNEEFPVGSIKDGHPVGRIEIKDEVPPGCEEEGSYTKVYICRNGSNCALTNAIIAEETVSLPATGHSPGEPAEENCVESGCEQCGSCDLVVRCTNEGCHKELSIETIEIPATGHDFHEEEGSAVEATCTTHGKHADMKCSRCDAVEAGDVILALGHDMGAWSDWKVIKEATSTSQGMKERYRYCHRCDHSEIESLAIPVIEIEYTPSYVSITDDGNVFLAEVDANGNVIFKDVFWELEQGSSAEETVTMLLNGKEYSFTRYADGRIAGILPSGFRIAGTDIVISGVQDPMDIVFLTHYAMSSLSSEPEEEEPFGLGSFGISESPSLDIPASASVGISHETASERSRTAGAATTTVSYTNSVSDALTSVLETETPVAETAGKASEDMSTAIPPADAETESGIQSPVQENGILPNLLLAIDLILGLGIIIGLGVLWKLGLIKY